MSVSTKEMSIRFNLDKPDQRRAYEYLQTMDKQIFRSCNNAVCLAVLDYFDRYYRVQEDPYLETREREEKFTQQIVDAVGESLKQALPLFLAGCMTGVSVLQPVCAPDATPVQAEDAPAEESAEPDPENIAWGFLGL